MGFLAHVPSGGALILPPLVIWYSSLVIQWSRSPALKGVLRLTSRVCKTPVSPAFCYLRLRGRRGRVSGRVVDDSPGPLSSPRVDAVLRSAVRPPSCRPFKGRLAQVPDWAGTGLSCPWALGKLFPFWHGFVVVGHGEGKIHRRNGPKISASLTATSPGPTASLQHVHGVGGHEMP